MYKIQYLHYNKLEQEQLKQIMLRQTKFKLKTAPDDQS